MTGRVALVTGGGRGIGAATVRLLAGRGYTVVFNYRCDHQSARALCQQVIEGGGQTQAICADVANEAHVRSLFARMDARFGPLSLLVNNAGLLGAQQRVEQVSAERLEAIFRTNVAGSFLCAREAIKRMSTRHGGSGGVIVNVSSVAARTGSPNEYVDYAASKGAVDTFTVGLAREVAADGIRVSAVRPGFIETDIHASGGEPDRVQRLAQSIPLRRPGQPEEVAEAIAWLASDSASYAVGSILDLAGGV